MLQRFSLDSPSGARSVVASLRQSASSRLTAGEEDLEERVAQIVADVRARGDQALVEYTQRFDGVDLRGRSLEVAREELEALAQAVPATERFAIEEAAEQLRSYFEAQYAAVAGRLEFERGGFEVVLEVRPVARAGIYVPGGRYRYPSTVLMTVIPAKVAGVEEVVLCTPPNRDKRLDPYVAAAAWAAGADRVFMVGGVQAVAALAYGTESVPGVDLVAGPGNAYVAAAKRQVFGDVGIDALAGPSELVVVAGDGADWGLVAVDLLAQTEHGPGGIAVAAVFSEGSADSLVQAVEQAVEEDGRPGLREDLEAGGAVVVCSDQEAAVGLVDEIAPEHLEVMLSSLEDCRAFAARVRSAGAIFLGQQSPAVFGDYVAGPSHVLPTGASARFSSGLGVYSFIRYRNTVRAADLEQGLAEAAAVFADVEGMKSHGESARARMARGRGAAAAAEVVSAEERATGEGSG